MGWFGDAENTVFGNRYVDLSLGIIFATAFPIARMLLTKFAYEPLGRKLLPSPKKTDEDPAVYAQKLRKWRESCWKMTVYITFTTVALLVSYKEPWFTDKRYMWLGCTMVPCNLSVSTGLLLFYCVEIGFYVQAIPFLFLEETKRKDRMESFIHHVATLGLLAYSYAVNFTRPGVMILLLHDCNDIFLEVAKLFRYIKAQTLCTVFFVIFAVSWVITRMVLFPVICMWSCLFDSIELAAKPANVNPEPHYTIFNSLLFIIFILNTYWTYLIFVVVFKNLKGTEVKDVREDDEQSDDD